MHPCFFSPMLYQLGQFKKYLHSVFCCCCSGICKCTPDEHCKDGTCKFSPNPSPLPGPDPIPVLPPQPVADANMAELIELHNKARAGSSWLWQINPLVADPKLMEYAQNWANTMASRRRMRHSSMRDIMALGFSRAAENIAWGQETPESVMNAWLWSPGHRRNIMSSSSTHIGCGAKKDENGRLYWCVCFGRPRE